jgi:very-short-patch-repair endonuclease
VRERTGCRVTSFLGTAYDLGRWSELVVMTSLGWRVLRVTSADVLGAADRTLAQVRALLALHGK